MDASLAHEEKALLAFLQLLPEEACLLECKPGQGKRTLFFAQKGIEVTLLAPNELQYLVQNDFAKQVLLKPINELVLPFHMFDGIWCSDFLAPQKKESFHYALHRFGSWLKRDGLLYAFFPEGEGDKVIQELTVQGKKERRIVYYQPEQLERIFGGSDFEIIDAWREGTGTRTFLHLLARNRSY